MKLFLSLLIFLSIPLCGHAQTVAKWSGLGSFGGTSSDGTNSTSSVGGLTYSGQTVTGEISLWAGFDYMTGMLVDIGDDESIMPYEFALEQNYPNPFNPSTKIEYSLAENSYVTITIFNLLGQTVDRLIQKEQAAGRYSVVWNGRSKTGEETASGVYFYKISAGEFSEIKKMLLLK